MLLPIRIAAASQTWGTAAAVRPVLSGLALLALALLAGDYLTALLAELVPPLDDDLGLALMPAVVTPAALPPARSWPTGHAATTRPVGSGHCRTRLVPPPGRARVRYRPRRRRASRRGARRSGRRGSRSASAPAPPRSQACPPGRWRRGGHDAPGRLPLPGASCLAGVAEVVLLLAGGLAHTTGALRASTGWWPGAMGRSEGGRGARPARAARIGPRSSAAGPALAAPRSLPKRRAGLDSDVWHRSGATVAALEPTFPDHPGA